METIKQGSSGNDVKILQKYLGLSQDGSFGPKTKEAVIKFQKEHNLTADGIVGPKTWEILEKVCVNSSESKCIDSSVIYSPLQQCVTKKSNRTIKYLVIHYTGGSNSIPPRAQNVKETFLQRLKEKKYGSADFAVDDRDMVQFNPDIKNNYCWAVGGNSYGNKGGKYYKKAINSNCISIEICSTCNPATKQAVSVDNHIGWSFTDATLNNAVKLSKIIMKKYNIPIENVIRHYDVTGKLCPALIGWNDEPIKNVDGTKTGEQNNSNKWLEFKNRLK